MKPDPTIARIREARHRISERCGHTPKNLVEYYMKLQEEKYADRLVWPTDRPPTMESGTALKTENPTIPGVKQG
jgi:hypothetical protein